MYFRPPKPGYGEPLKDIRIIKRNWRWGVLQKGLLYKFSLFLNKKNVGWPNYQTLVFSKLVGLNNLLLWISYFWTRFKIRRSNRSIDSVGQISNQLLAANSICQTPPISISAGEHIVLIEAHRGRQESRLLWILMIQFTKLHTN